MIMVSIGPSELSENELLSEAELSESDCTCMDTVLLYEKNVGSTNSGVKQHVVKKLTGSTMIRF